MWILLILCVNLNNPNDVPGKVLIPFDTKEKCEAAVNNSSFWIKFDSFTIKGECVEGKEINKKNLRSVRKS
jgi:hypothetical protein